MDGTLTEARQLIQEPMINQLIEVMSLGLEVGIVTGSPENYVQEQLGPFLEKVSSMQGEYVPLQLLKKLHILPCNGTEYIYYDDSGRNEIVPETMISELGENNFYELTAALISLQAEVLGQLKINDLALTGDFIQCRGPMINWCPIGRNANLEQRQDFHQYDLKSNFRQEYANILSGWLEYKGLSEKVTVALGGSTSFDIYPTGWNKTYATTWFGEHTCWFIGDKCQKGGNDYHLYELLRKHNRGYETSGPEETIKITKEILNTLSPGSSAG